MTHPITIRRAGFKPDTLDRDARTFDAVASTGAPVQRADARGAYIERLDLSKIDTASLIGVTILDAHRQGSYRDAIGVVQAARMEASALVVTIKIARGAEGDAVLDKIEDGVLRGVSIGYRGLAPVETKGAKGERIRTMTPEIVEISVTPIPADRGATIRSRTMAEDEADTIDRPETEADSRAEINRKIRLIGKVANLMTEWSDAQIDAEATVEEARAAAFDAMQTRRTTPATVRTNGQGGQEDAVTVRQLRGEALYARANPSMPARTPRTT